MSKRRFSQSCDKIHAYYHGLAIDPRPFNHHLENTDEAVKEAEADVAVRGWAR